MDWNLRYLDQDTPWEKGKATPVLDEILSRHPALFQGDLITPGCGTGHDARWLAARGCRVTGLDIAPLAIRQAQDFDAGHTCQFEVADFLNLSEKYQGNFDLLWEHTCFCAIDPSLRSAYLRAAHAALKTDGKVVGVFFIHPEMAEGESGPPFGISAADLEAAWDEAGFDLLDGWIPETGFQGRVGREHVMILKKRR